MYILNYIRENGNIFKENKMDNKKENNIKKEETRKIKEEMNKKVCDHTMKYIRKQLDK